MYGSLDLLAGFHGMGSHAGASIKRCRLRQIVESLRRS